MPPRNSPTTSHFSAVLAEFARIWLAGALAVGLWVASPAAVRAQGVVTDADQFVAAYNGAMAAFNAGKWPEAAGGFEAAIKLIIDDKIGRAHV